MNTKFHIDIRALHDGVTGSAFVIYSFYPNGERNRLLVDFGSFQGEKNSDIYNHQMDINPESFDAVLFTHTHQDHIGRIPVLFKYGFHGPVYCSYGGAALYRIAMSSSAHLQQKEKQPLYSVHDMENSVNALEPVEYDQGFSIGKNIKCWIFKNSHTVGSSCILIKFHYPHEESIYLFFSGDYNPKNNFFKSEEIPQWVKELPLIFVCESTYGYEDSQDVSTPFVQNLVQAIGEGKKVIIPAFAFERAQQILLRLKQCQDSGKLSRKIPIYLDSTLAINYTMAFLSNDDLGIELPDGFIPDNFHFASFEERELLINSRKQYIVVTSSGMGTYGPARQYIDSLIGNPHTLIHFSGYCTNDSIGRHLMKVPYGSEFKLFGHMHLKLASVKYTGEFSAHARADELLNFISGFNNIQLLVLNHGEPEVKEMFAERISTALGLDSVVISRARTLRVNTHGFIKDFRNPPDIIRKVRAKKTARDKKKNDGCTTRRGSSHINIYP